MEMNKKIVVVDYECMSPLGITFEETWSNLIQGKSGIDHIDRYAPEAEKIFGVSDVCYAGQIPGTFEELVGNKQKLKRWPDPTADILTKVCDTLLNRLSFSDKEHIPYRIAIIGATALTSSMGHEAVFASQKPVFNALLTRCHNIPLSLVATKWNIEGPQFSISAACASSGHATLIASDLLKSGTIDVALVCGFELPIQPINTGGFAWMNAAYVSTKDDRAAEEPTKASRPFSRDRKGIILSEGVAAMLMTTESYSEKCNWPIAGRLLGGAMNSSASLTSVDEKSITDCMLQAIKNSEIQIEQVDCINAHATSTPLGDKVEMLALQNIFNDRLRELPVVANKSQIGHTLGAASIFSSIFSLESMKQGILLPTLNYIEDENLPKCLIKEKITHYSHNLTLTNAFGFGGTNVSLLFSKNK